MGRSGHYWYDGGSCLVQCDEALSNSFTVERGCEARLCFSTHSFLACGGPLSENYLRTLATSIDLLNAQVSIVEDI